jgi:uncharacterized membrane protein YdbT with pleckstrin-like domain
MAPPRATTYDPGMPYPERLLTEGEAIVTEFRPHWRLLVLPILWVVAAIVAIVLVFQWIPPDNGTADLITALVIVVALFPVAVVPFFRWWFTEYVLTNERLITRRGIIARTGIEIPLENVNDVTFQQNMLERMLKSGDLLIESAGESGQSRFSDIPEPEAFQSLLYRTREDRTLQLQSGGSSAPADATERLERLARLHREGSLSDEEYEQSKRSILGEM